MGHPHALESITKRKGHKTLSEIIETFHRIKQERAKQSCFTPIQDGGKSRDLRDATKSRREDNSVSPSRNIEDIQRRRRVSLPSLFHPFSQSPVASDTEDNINDKRQHFQAHAKRRHSVSHVLVEYSKHDLEELAKVHEEKLEQMNKEYHKATEDVDKDKWGITDDSKYPRWLNGPDLHAFYNVWEQAGDRKTPRGHRALKHLNNNEQCSPRFRFNSF